jgi:hypothetical protein
MFKRMLGHGSIIGAVLLLAGGMAGPSQGAPVTSSSPAASVALVQLVRDRGGGPIFRGGGGGGFSGFRSGGGGGGPVFRGGGGGGFRGGPAFDRGGFRGNGGSFRSGGFGGRPAFRGGGSFRGDGGFAGNPRFRGFTASTGGFVRRPEGGPRGDRIGRIDGRGFKGWDRAGGKRWRHHGHWKHRHHRRRFARGFYWGPAFGLYGLSAYDYGYGYDETDCALLRERALATGSLYWWRRAELCEAGY